MPFTFTTSGAVKAAAGKDADINLTNFATNTGKKVGDQYNDWSDEAEAVICDTARYDLVTNYANLTSIGKEMLGKIENAMIAQKLINYDIMSFPSQRQAETILDALENDIVKGLNMIEDDKIKKFLSIT